MGYQGFSKQSGVALALAMFACGGAPMSQAKLAQAQAALHAAETLGAENDPKAKQSLQSARGQVADAQRLAKDGDGEEANLRLDRALADADLAAQWMRARAEADKAQAAWAKVKAMSGELGAPQ
jgi:hypothetical protein